MSASPGIEGVRFCANRPVQARIGATVDHPDNVPEPQDGHVAYLLARHWDTPRPALIQLWISDLRLEHADFEERYVKLGKQDKSRPTSDSPHAQITAPNDEDPPLTSKSLQFGEVALQLRTVSKILETGIIFGEVL